MLRLVLVLLDIVRLLILLCFVSMVRLWLLLFLVSFTLAQLRINFLIHKNDAIFVDNDDVKSAIQSVSGIEPNFVNVQKFVTYLAYIPEVCQPGYFWNTTLGTCDLCNCISLPSLIDTLWFEPL